MPSEVGIVNATATSVSTQLSWQPAVGAVAYEVEVDGKSISVGGKTTYSQKGLKPGTQHSYRVRGINVNGAGKWSKLLSVATSTSIPGVVDINNIRQNITNNSITLSWDDTTHAEGYKVELNGVEIYNGKNPSCTQYGLLPATQYSIRVKAYNSVGEGSWSNGFSINTCLLVAPLNIVALEGTDKIKLTWNAVDSATNYEIEINGNTITSVAGTSYEHSGLVSETTNTYRVRSKNPQGVSAWSDYISVQVLPSKPGVLQSITAVSSKDSIFLIWKDVVDAVTYDVELDGIIIDNDNEKQYIHDSLKPYTLHNYRVRAKNNAVEGEWSSPVIVRTLPDNPVSPDNITIKNTINSAVLTWDMPEDALSYDLEISDGINTSVASNIAKNTYTHRRAAAGAEYTYRLRTKNILGLSSWSGYVVNNAIKSQCKRGNDIELGLTAADIVDFSKYTLTVTYNPDVLEVKDLSMITPECELKEGKIKGTDITVNAFTPGKITFAVDKAINLGESWTGVINSIKFNAKVTGGTTITYTVISKVEE